MSEPGVPRAVVAGHAGVAAGLVAAAERIAGSEGALVAVSNDGLDTRGIEEAIRAALNAHGARVVFTDLPAGSCTMAARRIAKADPAVSVVTGANVAMLLDFLMGGGTSAGDLDRALQRGREAMTVHPGAPRAH